MRRVGDEASRLPVAQQQGHPLSCGAQRLRPPGWGWGDRQAGAQQLGEVRTETAAETQGTLFSTVGN